jgi:protein phosphatase
LTIAAHSDRGQVREENQDHLLIADLSAGPGEVGIIPHGQGSTVVELGPQGVLAVVADGMGGAAAGALASYLATRSIFETLTTRIETERNNSPRHFAERLQQVVRVANTRVYEEAKRDPSYYGMGSTATAAGILDNFLFLAHIGDSRAYLIRNGTAHQLTRDQSLVQQLIDSGSLSEAEAACSPQRHLLLQALGIEPEVDPDLTYQELRSGDTVVLCSDGLHDIVRPDEIANLAVNYDPATTCAALTDLANARGGPDNITVVVVLAEGDGLSPPGADDIVRRQFFS